MRRGRRDNQPDNRLDWRDPDMWIVRKVIDTDAFGFETEKTEYVYPGEQEEQSQGNLRNTTNPKTPHWSKDPTYDLAKGKRRRR